MYDEHRYGTNDLEAMVIDMDLDIPESEQVSADGVMKHTH